MRVMKNVMKRVGVFALAVALVAGMTPIYEAPESKALDAVSYQYYASVADAQIGNPTQGTVTAYNTVSDTSTYWSDSTNQGWYVVSGDVTISNRITVSGDVKLILKDSATLTANQGITVANNNKLTIYAQRTEDSQSLDIHMGALSISDVGMYNAGIGGKSTGTDSGDAGHEADRNGGNITINGGSIEVSRGDTTQGAAIGGANSGNGGTITINGGTVIAKAHKGAAIGGGDSGNGGTITINGGIVTATNTATGYDSTGAGIGGGSGGNGGEITINGGTVTAFATNETTSGTGRDSYGAGIGGGFQGAGGTITINGGVVDARATSTSGNSFGAGIGGGGSTGNTAATGSGGNITINGGYVEAIGGSAGTNGTGMGIGRGVGVAETGTLNAGLYVKVYADSSAIPVDVTGMTPLAKDAQGVVTGNRNRFMKAKTVYKCFTPSLPAAGSFTGSKSIFITTQTEEANIYYTTDGTEPSSFSTLYTGPFTIDATTTVKAIAIKGSFYDSEVASVTYTLDSGSSSGGSGSGGSDSGSGSGGGSSDPSPTTAPTAPPSATEKPAPTHTPTVDDKVQQVAAPSAETKSEPAVETKTDKNGTKTETKTTAYVDGSTMKEEKVTQTNGTVTQKTEVVAPDGAKESYAVTTTTEGKTTEKNETVSADGSKVESKKVVTEATGAKTITEKTENTKTKESGDFSKVTLTSTVKTDADGNITKESVKIETEKKTGETTQKSTYALQDSGSDKKTVALTKITTTSKNGKVTLPKTVEANGETYKVTVLKRGLLKDNDTKPKKVDLQAGSIKTVQSGAFNNLAKNGTITITGSKKQFKMLKNMIEKSGLPKGVKIKRA